MQPRLKPTRVRERQRRQQLVAALRDLQTREATFSIRYLPNRSRVVDWDTAFANLSKKTTPTVAKTCPRKLWQTRERLLRVVGPETAHGDYQPHKDPMHDHCKVVSWVVQQEFGGVILGVYEKDRQHYWNLLPCGTVVDFTATQYEGDLKGDGLNPVMEPAFVLLPPQDPASGNARCKLLYKRYLQQETA